MYYPRIPRSTCISISIHTCPHTVANLLKLVLTCMGNEQFHCLGVHHCRLLCCLIYIYIYICICIFILCFVDRASQHNHVKKNQLDAQLILRIFRQPPHVSGISRPIVRGTTVCIQKLVLIILFRWLSVVQSSKKNNKYHLLYTGCHRRKGPNFGRVFLMLNYTDITQNTYIQSWTVTEIMARERCGHLAFPRSIRLQCTAIHHAQ